MAQIIGAILIVVLPILYYMIKPTIEIFRENRKIAREKKQEQKKKRKELLLTYPSINTTISRIIDTVFVTSKHIMKKFRENIKTSRENKIRYKLQQKQLQESRALQKQKLAESQALQKQKLEESLPVHPFDPKARCPKCGAKAKTKFTANYRKKCHCYSCYESNKDHFCGYKWIMQTMDESDSKLAQIRD